MSGDNCKVFNSQAVMIADPDDSSTRHLALIVTDPIKVDSMELRAALDHVAMIMEVEPDVIVDIYHTHDNDTRQVFHVVNSYGVLKQWNRINFMVNQRAQAYEAVLVCGNKGALLDKASSKRVARLTYDEAVGMVLATDDGGPEDSDVIQDSKYECKSRDELRHMLPSSLTSLAIIASYSDQPSIPQFLIMYAKELRCHFDHVIILTNTRLIDAKSMEEAKAHATVLTVPNQNLDFGMWARVLVRLRMEDFPMLHRILLTNDSVEMVNTQSFRAIMHKAESYGQVWGLTNTPYVEDHLQSYFVVFNSRAAIQHMLVFFKRKQWNDMTEFAKIRIVDICELGLSSFMSAKFTLNSVYRFEDVIKIKSKTDIMLGCIALRNPTYTFWDKLAKLGCPLIKRRKMIIYGEDHLTEVIKSGVHVLSNNQLFIAR